MMTISQGMTYALAAALVALSARAAFAPRGAALAYGVPIPEGDRSNPLPRGESESGFRSRRLACRNGIRDPIRSRCGTVHRSDCSRRRRMDGLAPWEKFRHRHPPRNGGIPDRRGCPCRLGALTCVFAAVLVCHVLGAIGVGPIFTLPFLANIPAALHAVLVLLRFGAGATLVSGILLWVVLKPGHPLWLYLSSALFFAVIALIGIVLEPAVDRSSDEPKMREPRSLGRHRLIGARPVHCRSHGAAAG